MDTEKQEKSPTARSVVKQLRKHILQFREGDYLGSEDDLLALVPVSRPTLRQAIRVLEHEQLLSARRGVKGGYYARRPSLDSVVASAALYLSDRNTGLWDFMRVAEVLNIEMCRLASLSTNEEARTRLRAVLLDQWSSPFTSDDECLGKDAEMELLLLEVAMNPAIELYMRVNFRFGAFTLNLRVFRDSMERRELWRQQRLRLGEAILNRETEIAQAYGKRHYKIMNAWFREILADESSPPAAADAPAGTDTFFKGDTEK